MRYFVSTETVNHPESFEVIVSRGECITKRRVAKLMVLGVDQLKGYWCATLGAVDDARKRVANSDAFNV